MESERLPQTYEIAEGPDGLATVLIDLHEKAQANPTFAADDQYILYRNNQQKALIKIDMRQMPYQFWYYDLLGRPATNNIKETIAKFLWIMCNERTKYLGDGKR